MSYYKLNREKMPTCPKCGSPYRFFKGKMACDCPEDPGKSRYEILKEKGMKKDG